jgi:hypothetical protein
MLCQYMLVDIHMNELVYTQLHFYIVSTLTESPNYTQIISY